MVKSPACVKNLCTCEYKMLDKVPAKDYKWANRLRQWHWGIDRRRD